MLALTPRAALRTRCYLGGRVAYAHRSIIVHCVVWDLSSDGARLILPDAEPLPREFDLDIRQRESFRARVVWRRGNVCGVRFLKTGPAYAYEPTYADKAPIGV